VVVNVDWPSFTSGIVVDDGTDELGELGVEEDVLTIVVTLNKIIDTRGDWYAGKVVIAGQVQDAEVFSIMKSL
jgi:hypothetical protein